MNKPHLQAEKLKEKLDELIAVASQVETKLAEKLKAIAKHLKEMRNGTLISKKYLLLGLREILADTEVWLCYRLASPEEQQQIKDSLFNIERYWYLEIFPTWFKQYDKNFNCWKKFLIDNEHPQDDANVIANIGRTIERHQRKNKNDNQHNKIISKLIADKAIATDLIATANQNDPLCVQLTQSSIRNIENNKIRAWEETYSYYEIKRGLFASYNPRYPDYINWLINHITIGSDNINKGEYKKVFLK